MKKLLIIDGNSIINRAFYAVAPLTTDSGLNTNGIYGFLNIFLKVMGEEKPDFCTVAFDLKAPTFRHKMFSEYKATRHGMPQELAEQMPVLKDVLHAMNIKTIEKEGYEADDLIGTVSAMCENAGVECRILTGDRDDLQLASDKTAILLTTTSKGQTQTVIYDDKAVYEKYGVTPKMLIDVKGLMGDSSDNIPGVMGIGEKTATTLISKYKTIEGVYENIGELKGAMLKKIEDGREMAFLSRELATIMRDVPLEEKIEDFEVKPYSEELIPLLQRLQFKKIIEKMADGVEAPEKENVSAEVLSCETLPEIGGKFYFEIDGEDVLFAVDNKVFKSKALCLKHIFEDKNILKYGNDLKSAKVKLHGMGIGFYGFGFDPSIAAYLIEPARNNFALSALCSDFLGVDADLGGGTLLLPKLCEKLLNRLSEDELLPLFEKIELPLIEVLADMQIKGFTADREMLVAFSKKLGEEISELEKMIYTLAGEEFNINSPKQLGVILFEKLELKGGKKTKTGYSTSVDVLEKLRSKHPIIPYILDYRHKAKLKSTYADGLQTVINPETGKIHSTFNQTVTTTGRISSTEPNLQNIPIRTELGRELRRVFVAESDDYVLVDADYSQIELRVLASISKDEKMIEAFKSGVDIHTKTASEVFGVADFMVNSDMRRNAKAVNFGIVYGISEFSLAEDIHTSRAEAKEYMEKYLETYSGVRQFMKDTVEFAREHGYVKTLSDRRRYIPEINASNFNVRSFGERVALNAPIQGTAADIIKIAMINVYNALREKAPHSRLILQVHDELIVEAHKDEKDIVLDIVKKEMENAFPLSVPLAVDMSEGRSWYDAK